MESFPRTVPEKITALAFDFGTRRIGVAYGQSLTGTARPLPVLPARDGIPDWDRLVALTEEWQPDVFVVGMPFNMDDSDSELLLRARKFANRLHGRLHRPCYGMDERLTSFEARGQLMREETSGELDSVAARLILEGWFAALEARRRENG
ncbi:MAG: Holliday junction resolvase RuvX [Pseudomonadota bacterium]